MRNAQDKERFIELRAEGRSFADIAATLGASKTTLVAWGKELTADVANARTLRLDALFEQYAVSKARRDGRKDMDSRREQTGPWPHGARVAPGS